MYFFYMKMQPTSVNHWFNHLQQVDLFKLSKLTKSDLPMQDRNILGEYVWFLPQFTHKQCEIKREMLKRQLHYFEDSTGTN